METIKNIQYAQGSSLCAFIDATELEDLSPQLVIADKHTVNLFSLPESWKDRLLVIEPGEENKQLRVIENILERAVLLGLDRTSTILGIGGGVVTDMTAFAASLYMRGCSVILMPTTLLAMVDAALGGKTGVDFLQYKNMIGSFYPAQQVLMDPTALISLSDREYRSGMAEAIKTAFLGDAELLNLLEQKHDALLAREIGVLKEVIERCVMVKGQIVEEDLKEGGIRAWLNLGHTFGHALESASGFSAVSHGEGVAWGMACALDTGLKMGLTDKSFYDRAMAILERWEYPLKMNTPVEAIEKAMFQDKKKQTGKLRYILLKNLEEPWIGEIAPELIRSILKQRTYG